MELSFRSNRSSKIFASSDIFCAAIDKRKCDVGLGTLQGSEHLLKQGVNTERSEDLHDGKANKCFVRLPSLALSGLRVSYK
jgi:hypothetical protein